MPFLGRFRAFLGLKVYQLYHIVSLVWWYSTAQNLTFAGQNVLSLRSVEEESPGNIEYPAS